MEMYSLKSGINDVTLNWSSENYSIHELIHCVSLPKLIKVCEGYYSEIESETFSAGDIILLRSVQEETKLILRPVLSPSIEYLEDNIKIPLDHTIKVIVDNAKVRKYSSVYELIKNLPEKVLLNSELEVINAVDRSTVCLHKGTVLKVYDIVDNYLRGKYKCNEVFLNQYHEGHFVDISKETASTLVEVIENFTLPINIWLLEPENKAVDQDECHIGLHTLVKKLSTYVVEGNQITFSHDNHLDVCINKTALHLSLDNDQINEIEVRLSRSNTVLDYVLNTSDHCVHEGFDCNIQSKMEKEKKKMPPKPPPRVTSISKAADIISTQTYESHKFKWNNANANSPVLPPRYKTPWAGDRSEEYKKTTPDNNTVIPDSEKIPEQTRLKKPIKIKVVDPKKSAVKAENPKTKRKFKQTENRIPPIPSRNIRPGQQVVNSRADESNKWRDEENPYMSMNLIQRGCMMEMPQIPTNKRDDTETLNISSVPQTYRDSLILVHKELQFNIPVINPQRKHYEHRPVRRVCPIVNTDVDPPDETNGFSSMCVVDLVQCFRDCKLENLADLCLNENLDGNFINGLSISDLKIEPFCLSPIQMLKLKQIKKGWRPIFR